MKQAEKLQLWQQRLDDSLSALAEQTSRMDWRERLYRGSRRIRSIVQKDSDRGGGPKEATHVRNLVAELIEAQVDSSLPQPKVTPMYKEDEELARLIEDMLRNEMDRLPFEAMNDMAERTAPIQGGGYYLVDWDEAQRTHTTVGELAVSFLHPKLVATQNGVWTGIEDMDYFFIQTAQTKEAIRRRYGVDVSRENESDPALRGDTTESQAEDLVTLNQVYYRNPAGGIGRFAWVNQLICEDMTDYQSRRVRVCADCGRPQRATDGADQGTRCPLCGGVYHEREQEYEELWQPLTLSDGRVIPLPPARAGAAQPLRIPYYRPGCYPLILRKNISLYGQLLGDSDVDKIEDQQNTYNILSAKINDKFLTGGSYMVLPRDASIKTTAEELKVIYPKNAADAQLIRPVSTVNDDIQYFLVQRNSVYEEARQTVGITNSFQGREDDTATSGRAKMYSAQLTAGRLQSKRIMKNAAWAALFQLMFKFKLAYADEARPVTAADAENRPIYKQFNRYDFLRQDTAGAWYWNDRFLFSVDDSSDLAANRNAMWQETLHNLQAGAFGNPANLDTLIAYWVKMEQLHYPGAGETKEYLLAQRRQASPATTSSSATTTSPAAASSRPATPAAAPAAAPALPDFMGKVDLPRVL